MITQSFWMAETLKYFFLVFSDPDVISLDDYVPKPPAKHGW
jgi:mannosyl-oligosaccharide alpha-1,2-mannosidase